MTKDTQQEPNESKDYDLEIKKHYDKVAEADKDASSSTMADLYIRENEKGFIRNSHFVSFFSNAFPKNVGNYSPLKTLCFTKI